MLEPLDTGYQMDQQFQSCDSISSTNCISTPFFVKDILNMPNDEYVATDVYAIGQTKEQYYFDEGFHHWDQSAQYQGYENPYCYNEQMNNNCVKMEVFEDYHVMPSHVQELSNFCVPFADEKQQVVVESTTEPDNSSKSMCKMSKKSFMHARLILFP